MLTAVRRVSKAHSIYHCRGSQERNKTNSNTYPPVLPSRRREIIDLQVTHPLKTSHANTHTHTQSAHSPTQGTSAKPTHIPLNRGTRLLAQRKKTTQPYRTPGRSESIPRATKQDLLQSGKRPSPSSEIARQRVDDILHAAHILQIHLWHGCHPERNLRQLAVQLVESTNSGLGYEFWPSRDGLQGE